MNINENINIKSILKVLITISPLFLVLYFETIALGALTLSIAWKVIFLGVLVLVLYSRVMQVPLFVWLSYIYCLKSILVLGIIDYPVETITPVMGWVAIPLIYQAVTTFVYSNKYNMDNIYYVCNENLKRVQNWVLGLLILISLSVIPFWLGLEPIVKTKTLLSFGSDDSVFLGVFQNVHAASGILAITSVSLLYYAGKIEAVFLKNFCYVCSFIALFAVFQTFVRTGMLMFLVGFIVMNVETFKEKKLTSLVLISLLLIFVAYYLYTDPVLLNRIMDNRAHGMDGGYKDIGSGRLYIWETNINNLLDSGIIGIALGFGVGLSKTLMNEAIGLSLVSHSGFVDALVQNGVIGLIIYISYFFSLFSYIKKFKNHQGYSLVLSLFFMYLTFQFFQGGNQFIFTLIFAPLLVLLKAMQGSRS